MAKGNAKRKLMEKIKKNEELLKSNEIEDLFLQEIKSIKRPEDKLVSVKNVSLNLEDVTVEQVHRIADFKTKSAHSKKISLERLKLLHLLAMKNNDKTRIELEIELIKSLNDFVIKQEDYFNIVSKMKQVEKGKEDSYVQKALVPYLINQIKFGKYFLPRTGELYFSKTEHDIAFKLIKFYYHYSSPLMLRDDLYVIPVRYELIDQILKRLQ